MAIEDAYVLSRTLSSAGSIAEALKLYEGCLWVVLKAWMAEGEGFEPPLPFRVKRFSRPPVSTAHTSLRAIGMNSLAAKE